MKYLLARKWPLGWFWTLLLLVCWERVLAQPLKFERAQVLAVAGLNEGFAFASAMTADAQGNRYVTGHFGGIQHFGATTLQVPAGSGFDMYVAKVDTSGRVIWAVQGGGASNDYSRCLALDAQGNVYVAGDYLGPTATYGATTLRNTGNGSYFIAKLSNNGQWLWAQGGSDGDNIQINSLAISRQGAVWLAGGFGALRPAATLGSFSLSSAGAKDIVVAQLSAAGNWLRVATAGGLYEEEALGIALDASDNIYVTGSFTSTTVTFNNQVLAHSVTASSYNPDVFVAKLASVGGWQWAVGGGGAGQDAGYGLAMGQHNRLYLTGAFQQAAFFGATRLASLGSSDVLTACLTQDGTWQWAVAGGSSGADFGISIAATPLGEIYVGGSFGLTGTASSTAHFGAITLLSAGSSDAFVSRLDSVGGYTAVLAGGGQLEDGCASVVMAGGRLYAAGYISSSINISPTAQFGASTIDGNPTTYGRMYTAWLARLSAPSATANADPLAYWDAQLNIPNIITPNGDARNDAFAPANLPAGPWELTVFSRWGQQVYKNTDYQSNWGIEAATGTYFYLLRHAPTGRVYKAWLEVAR